MSNRLMTMPEVLWSFRQALTDDRAMRNGVRHQFAYDIRSGKKLDNYQCLRTGLSVTLEEPKNPFHANRVIACEVLFRGRFKAAIMKLQGSRDD